MEEDQKQPGGEEVRSPLQAIVRVILLIVVVVALAGFFIAVFLRPEEVVEPEEEAARPADQVLRLQSLAMAPVSQSG